MYFFNNDYSEIGHFNILNAFIQNANKQYDVYGNDEISDKAKEKLRSIIKSKNVDIHFLIGGTLANKVAISHFLKSYEAVICSNQSHISINETGAIENIGIRLLEIEHSDGKININDIEKKYNEHFSEHMVIPKLLYISNTTEYGTVYTEKELKDIYEISRKLDMYVYIDGARISNALVEGNYDLDLIAKYSDAFTFGIAKNGALSGEAIIISNDDLKKNFRHSMKQKGAIYSKGFILGIQFYEMLKGDLYLNLASHANNMAKIFVNKLKENKVKFYSTPESNVVFPILNNDLIEKLKVEFKFHILKKYDDNNSIVRFVFSWNTDENDVKILCDRFIELFNI